MAAKPASNKRTARDLDLQQRDPLDLNSHLQVEFEDILAEANGAHAIDCVWRNTFRCYECWKNCWYKTLTLLCALCIACYWGCHFAEVACCHVYCLTPAIKSYAMRMKYIKEINMLFYDAVCGPCCTVCGNIFSRIRVQKE